MCMRYLKNIFTLDLRALAVFRILLGICLMLDMISRFSMSVDFYSDFGTLPRTVLIDQVELPWKMSLLMLNGSHYFSAALSLFGVISALFIIFGRYTRFFTFLGWILLCSFHARHPLVVHGGDNVIRMLFFWGFFLPLDKRWSVDSSSLQRSGDRFFGPFNFGIIFQILFIYSFTFLYKWDPAWHSNFTAFYYAMNLDMFTTTLGRYLLNFPQLLSFLTFMTLWLEGLGTLFILCTHKYSRRLLVLIFIGLHVGIELTMNLGLFPLACITAWTIFLDTELLDSISSFLPKLRLKFLNKFRVLRLVLLEGFNDLEFTGKKSIIATVLLTTIIFAWNLEGLGVFKRFDIRSPVNEFVFALQLNQQWNMFAPSPTKNDGYFVVEGTLRNGSVVDPLTEDKPLFVQPKDFSSSYRNAAWNKYLLNLYSSNWSSQRLYFGKYICRMWNDRHVNDEAINNFRFYFMLDRTVAPNEKPSQIKQIFLWEHFCFAGN